MELNPVISQRTDLYSWMVEHGYTEHEIYLFLTKSQRNPVVWSHLLKPFGLPDELVFD